MKYRRTLTLFRRRSVSSSSRASVCTIILVFTYLGVSIFAQSAIGAASRTAPSHFRIGEKLTYSVSFGKFDNAGYAEMYVVSRGKIAGKDAVELRSKIKTLEFVSAAFFLFDESRVVYASPETGLPLYIDRSVNDGPLPKEIVSNYLSEPTSNFDLLSLIYKARETGGVGTFPLSEDGQMFNPTCGAGENQEVKTAAGVFETNVSTVESEYLAAKGVTDLKINFAANESRVPILIRFKTVKGEFRAELAGIQNLAPIVAVVVPTPSITPRPRATPKPTPSPDPYIENTPLAPELGFGLGESLDYNITAGGKPVAAVNFSVKERKLFEKQDSLLLTATITGIEQGNQTFSLGDSIRVQVNPETLAPRFSESTFGAALSILNQTLRFDQKTGMVAFGGPNKIDAPIGTHTILSLIYAMRSFNLKPSKDPNNPVNDTRVAVFWNDHPLVFTIRPSNEETLTINDEKVSAQLITVNTGN